MNKIAQKSVTDFVSQVNLAVTESAANTLTFAKIETGIAPLERIGWVVQRLVFRLTSADFGFFNGSGDTLSWVVAQSNQLTTISDTDPAILWKDALTRVDAGAAANAQFEETVIDHDFSNLQGGGLLVLPNPLYIGAVGSGLTAAATVSCRMFFYAIEMSDSDYFNLVQSRQILINS